MDKKKLPIGYDDYKEVVEGQFYYIDKTLFIKELIDNMAKVSLFTRPRRFGKSLNLSMLRYFFEKPLDGRSNKALFEDKKIQKEGEQYLKYQEQFPIIQLSLKSGKQAKWDESLSMLKLEIAKEYKRHSYILDGKISDSDKERFLLLMEGKAEYKDWLEAIAFLSRCLAEYYNQKVIILIDEYDVPLENAYYSGFYEKMIGFIRSLFESALKSNLALEFAVITGCLRISKESIFTGLNNFNIISIMNEVYAEHFGFTQKEVNEILNYYNIEEKSNVVKEWYDGYIFGKTEVYNPWSVINFISALKINAESLPIEYWSNTSSNSIVKDLITHATMEVRTELEALTRGESIEKMIHEDITYEDVYDSQENLWNFLYFTGYLKAVCVKMVDDDRVATLKIPNKEVKKIYRQQIINWTRQNIKKKDLSNLYKAILEGNGQKIQEELAPLLVSSISYMDSYENFYHGFILGILMNLDNYKITSNRESGDGRYDISMESADGFNAPVIIEFKIASQKPELEAKANEALKQIVDKRYDAPFVADGYDKCVHIGIGFYKKMCRVKTEVVTLSYKF